MSLRRSLAGSVFLLLAATTARAADAPPLSERIPADAMIYAGWAGADGCPGYAGSHLKAVVDASAVPQLFTQFVPAVIRRVGRQDAHAAGVLEKVVAAGSPVWHHPTAFYFGGVDFDGPRPVPRLAVLCDAGADAPSLAAQVERMVADLPPDADPRPIVKAYGGLVVVSMLPPDATDAAFAAPAANPLSRAAPFTAALGQCRPAGAVAVGYVDVQAIVAAVDDGVRRANQEAANQNWPKARDALGLSGFRRLAVTAGFDGRDWVERAFASTDGRHDGLLAAFDARPLDDDLLSVVPQSADRASAWRLDLAGGFDAARSMTAALDADTAGQVEDAIGKVNQAAGVDVRRDLLGPLGDQWVTYSDRASCGSGLLGTVLVNRLRDAAKFDGAMTLVSRRLNFVVAHQVHDPNIEIQVRESEVAGTTLHYLAVPLVTPTWAVHNGSLYVGLYPQVVTAAIETADRHGPSILQRPEFAALTHRLGDRPAASVSFTDLPAVAPESYGELLAASRLYLGAGDLFGAHPPPLVVPTLGRILPELSPAGGVTWADAAGWHASQLSPFPGSDAFSSGGLASFGVAQEALLTGMLLPALNKGRDAANRVKSAANEREIGQGLMVYAASHQGVLPDDLGALLVEGMSPAMFISPHGNTAPPPPGTDPATWVNESGDYAYLGKGLKVTTVKNPSEFGIAYEKDGARSPDGINLLFLDGHVAWRPKADADELLARQQQDRPPAP